jgi:hypothetical protein
LDETQLEDARVEMRGRGLPGAARGSLQNLLDLLVALATRQERDLAIRGEASFQALSLADVDDLAVRIDEAVHPRLVGSQSQDVTIKFLLQRHPESAQSAPGRTTALTNRRSNAETGS